MKIRENVIYQQIEKVTMITIGALLVAIALNFFLIPANVFASGFTGVAQLLATLLPLSTGILLFLLNIPVAILGWLKLGKSFTLYSFLNIALTTLFLELIPIVHISPDILLNAVFGGVITAIGVGLTLRWGASTGGVDIIALVLSKESDRSIGIYFFLINALVVTASGFLFDIEKALYTLVTLYVTSRVIDVIHTRYVKLTAMIVTSKAESLLQAIYEKIQRGVTRVPAKGGYSAEDKEILLVTLTMYEVYELRRIIQQVDEKAFTTILETAKIFGFFRKE